MLKWRNTRIAINRNCNYLVRYNGSFQSRYLNLSQEAIKKEKRIFQKTFRKYSNHSTTKHVTEVIDLEKFTPDKIRNYAICAHIDAGKTTLATRLMKLTNTLQDNDEDTAYLDKLQVEKERGITVKAQTCSMIYRAENGEAYLYNLLDTPGHFDFKTEVERSLRACQAAIVLVDSNQGVQAQTLSNFYIAVENELEIVPVMTKIDLNVADAELVEKEMVDNLGVDPKDILKLSAKSGVGCVELLERLTRCPPPKADRNKPLRALLFDSWFDPHVGSISLIELYDGTLSKGDRIQFYSTGQKHHVTEIGILHPERVPCETLYAGQVGYIICNIKTTSHAPVGETIFRVGEEDLVEPFPQHAISRPTVYAGIFPVDGEDFSNLEKAMKKLCLNDPSVEVRKDSSPALGSGFKIGCHGVLHLEVFQQRLSQEFSSEVIVASPSVAYEIVYTDGRVETIQSATDFPQDQHHKIAEIREPFVNVTLIFPKEYGKAVITLCQSYRGQQTDVSFIGTERMSLIYKLPLSEIIYDFGDLIKANTRGYATMDYEDAGFQESDIAKVKILVHNEEVEPFCFMSHRSLAHEKGKKLIQRLKEILPKQMFDFKIQASVGSKIIASETVKAYRKDVTSHLYGRDVTRKKKLLEQQKAGKKKMKMIGSVQVPNSAFKEVFKAK